MANERRLMLIDLLKVRKAFNEEYKESLKIIQGGDTYLDNLAEGFFEAEGVIEQLGKDVTCCQKCEFYEKASYALTGGICNYWDCGDTGCPNTVKPDDFCSYGKKSGTQPQREDVL